MEFHEVFEHFTLKERPYYNSMAVHQHWMIIPTMQPNGRFLLWMLNPEGQRQDEFFYPEFFREEVDGGFGTPDEAIDAGRKFIDVWMCELKLGI